MKAQGKRSEERERIRGPEVAPLIGLIIGSLGALLLLFGIFGLVYMLAAALLVPLALAPMGFGVAALARWARRAVAAPVPAAAPSPAEAPVAPAPAMTLEMQGMDMGSLGFMSEPAPAASPQGVPVYAMAHNGPTEVGGQTRAPLPSQGSVPSYPRNAVLAVIDREGDAQNAIQALMGEGLQAEEATPSRTWAIEPRTDGAGSGRPGRTLWRRLRWLVTEEERMFGAYVDESLAGRHIVAVHVHRSQDVQRAAAILATHRAHTIRRFGRWLTTDLVPMPAPARAATPQTAAKAAQEFETVAAHELRAVDIFHELSPQQLAEVAAVGRHVRLAQGTLLARQGEQGARVYVILEGQVELTTSSPQGEITIRIASPGESLPLAALLGERRLISTAAAMSDLRAMEISCEAFHDLCRRHPEIGMTVYQAVADILGGRYRNTLTRLVGTLEKALRRADVFANV